MLGGVSIGFFLLFYFLGVNIHPSTDYGRSVKTNTWKIKNIEFLYSFSQNSKTHSFLFFPRNSQGCDPKSHLDLQVFKILQIQFWGFLDLSGNGSKREAFSNWSSKIIEFHTNLWWVDSVVICGSPSSCFPNILHPQQFNGFSESTWSHLYSAQHGSKVPFLWDE